MAVANSLSRNRHFDVIRGLAIASVVFVHTSQVVVGAASSSPSESNASPFIVAWGSVADLGKYGVELFFLLSGVLIASIYGSKKGDFPDFSFRTYFSRRLGRIYPLWLVFALASLGLTFVDRGWWMSLAEVAGGGVAGNAVVAVSTLLFLTWALLPSTSERALAGGWSIESEMTHYILFPLFRKFEISGLFTVLAISGFLAWLSDLASDHLQTLSPLTIRLEALSIFTTFPFFVIGMILGKSQGATLRASFNAALMYLRTNKIMGFFLMLGLILLSANELPYGNVAEASVFCLAMFLLSFPILRSAKATQFLVWVGKYSYFTYFFHFWIISGIIYALELQNSRNISSLLIEIWWTLPLLNILLFCFVVLICQVIGAVSFRYFEAPWIRKSRKA